jgi:hypothetical protein
MKNFPVISLTLALACAAVLTCCNEKPASADTAQTPAPTLQDTVKRGEYLVGILGCNDCHDMHGDEPAMQVRAGRAGDGACTSCHGPSDLSGGAAHGGHARATTCQDCHMPRITYGLLEGMISHRITIPRPQAWIGRHDQPDACTQCHVDRSRTWAAESMPRLGFPAPAQLPAPETLHALRA